MSGQIIFFEKAASDFSNPNVSATASQGSAYAVYALNRTNLSAWITTGSVDADATAWTVDFVDARKVSDILLLKHNFKNFRVQYWDGAAYQDFIPAINETANTATSNYYRVTEVSTSKLRVTINGTQVANSDKFLYQFIATRRIGQLDGWPVIKNPTISKLRRKSTMLSGKQAIGENVGAFSMDIEVAEWRSDADLTIVETLYDSIRGFLVWPCGGVTSQFSSSRQGYRMEDIFLMKPMNEYTPEWVGGIYSRGLKITMKLAEVVD